MVHSCFPYESNCLGKFGILNLSPQKCSETFRGAEKFKTCRNISLKLCQCFTRSCSSNIYHLASPEHIHSEVKPLYFLSFSYRLRNIAMNLNGRKLQKCFHLTGRDTNIILNRCLLLYNIDKIV